MIAAAKARVETSWSWVGIEAFGVAVFIFLLVRSLMLWRSGADETELRKSSVALFAVAFLCIVTAMHVRHHVTP